MAADVTLFPVENCRYSRDRVAADSFIFLRDMSLWYYLLKLYDMNSYVVTGNWRENASVQ